MSTAFLFTTRIHRPLGKLLFVSSMVLCIALSQTAHAVIPPPDGGYPGGNTAEGQNGLFNLTTGGYNSAIGFFSLQALTTGNFNTAVGAGTLFTTTIGEQNTATGAGALLSNTVGAVNSAHGAFALFNNINGVANTAVGHDALFSNTKGTDNTAIGNEALASNTDGQGNTAVGVYALNTTTGTDNTAVGMEALISDTTGAYNTAVGTVALSNDTTGTNNLALGYLAGFKIIGASNVICIGHLGEDVSDSCFIGNIRDVTTVNNDAIPVVIDSHGQLGTVSSSRRFKNEIKAMDKTSEAVLALKPVTFHYRSDKTRRAEFGLIAEEVAEVNPDLVMRDKNGAIYTVRYDAVNAMLLNEFLKEHRKVEQMEKQIEALASGLEKVSAQLEVSQLSKQVASKNR